MYIYINIPYTSTHLWYDSTCQQFWKACRTTRTKQCLPSRPTQNNTESNLFSWFYKQTLQENLIFANLLCRFCSKHCLQKRIALWGWRYHPTFPSASEPKRIFSRRRWWLNSTPELKWTASLVHLKIIRLKTSWWFQPNLKNISQTFPQIGMNIWNHRHHLKKENHLNQTSMTLGFSR